MLNKKIIRYTADIEGVKLYTLFAQPLAYIFYFIIINYW